MMTDPIQGSSGCTRGTSYAGVFGGGSGGGQGASSNDPFQLGYQQGLEMGRREGLEEAIRGPNALDRVAEELKEEGIAC